MRFRTYQILIPVAALLLLSKCSCDLFGATGALLISENDESRLGYSFDSTLAQTDSGKKQFPIFAPKSDDSAKARDYVVNLAQEILHAIPKDDRPGYDFKFTLIDQPVINAFAVPGGYVYIYTGIIKAMKDESELACVLGHEITHVTHHHYRDAMAKEAGLSLLLQALLGNNSGQLAQLVGASLGQMALLKVSRDNESEADQYGTEYAGNVGRNPLGVAKFFSRMPKEGLLAMASTHPAPETRVADVEDEVQSSATLKALAADSANTNYTSRFLQATAVLRK
jgi:predicted Zn-dependent protease